jgi:hypothetical protein
VATAVAASPNRKGCPQPYSHKVQPKPVITCTSKRYGPSFIRKGINFKIQMFKIHDLVNKLLVSGQAYIQVESSQLINRTGTLEQNHGMILKVQATNESTCVCQSVKLRLGSSHDGHHQLVGSKSK